MTTRPAGLKFKVCCIRSFAEAELAIHNGADFLGFVSAMPSGPGVIELAQIRDIVAAVHAMEHRDDLPVCVLLTSHLDAESILEDAHFCAVGAIQLVHHVDLAVHHDLSMRAPELHRIQVIHVEDERAISMAQNYAQHCDYLLLDSGRPSALQGGPLELGGTGRTHDWEISAAIVNRVDKPVFLAGGLNPANVNTAVARVRPFAVDACSGLRSSNMLDAAKLTNYVSELDAIDRHLM